MVERGARLIGTNPDLTGPVEQGITPGTGALIAPIEPAISDEDLHRFACGPHNILSDVGDIPGDSI